MIATNFILFFPYDQMQAGSNLFLNGIVLGTLYIGGSLLATNQLKPGDLMSFLVAAQTIQRSLAQLSILFGTYVRGISAGARVFEVRVCGMKVYILFFLSILYKLFVMMQITNFRKTLVSPSFKSHFTFQYIKLEPSIPLKGGKIIPYHTLMGNIEFRNVSFAYPTRPDQV